MGYPTEIPNSIPRRQPVPLQDPFTRLWQLLCRALSVRRPRKRVRRDRLGPFATGVRSDLPPLERSDAASLDWRALEESL